MMINDYSKKLQLLIDQITNLQTSIPKDLPVVVQKISASTNNVICVGVGKSGYIAQKMSATLASIGVVSFYLHPTEGVHGDLGRIRRGDICVIFSHSGNSTELIPILNYCHQCEIETIGISGNPRGKLARETTYSLNYNIDRELCPNNLAPTSSTTLSLIIADLICVGIIHLKDVTEEKFARFHPGGSLGKMLQPVALYAQAVENLPQTQVGVSVRQARNVIGSSKYGCALIYEKNAYLGIVTDGDLRAESETNKITSNSRTITRNPLTIPSDATVRSAIEMISQNNVNILFIKKDKVIDSFIHYSDVLELDI